MTRLDFCCGFSWKVGCRLYAICDIIFSLISFAIYVVMVDALFNPALFLTTLKKQSSDLLNTQVYPSPQDHSVVSANNLSPEEEELRNFINKRIYSGCDKKVSLNSADIYKRLVLSVSFFALGSCGFLFTAVLFLIATCLKKKRCLCIIVILSETLSLSTWFTGGILFVSKSLCPLNYNVDKFPRQSFLIYFSIAVLLYKLHEMYTTYRFMSLEEFPLREAKLSLSQEALRSRRKSYAQFGGLPLPRKSLLWQAQMAELEPEDGNEMSVIVPPSKAFLKDDDSADGTINEKVHALRKSIKHGGTFLKSSTKNVNYRQELKQLEQHSSTTTLQNVLFNEHSDITMDTNTTQSSSNYVQKIPLTRPPDKGKAVVFHKPEVPRLDGQSNNKPDSTAKELVKNNQPDKRSPRKSSHHKKKYE